MHQYSGFVDKSAVFICSSVAGNIITTASTNPRLVKGKELILISAFWP